MGAAVAGEAQRPRGLHHARANYRLIVCGQGAAVGGELGVIDLQNRGLCGDGGATAAAPGDNLRIPDGQVAAVAGHGAGAPGGKVAAAAAAQLDFGVGQGKFLAPAPAVSLDDQGAEALQIGPELKPPDFRGLRRGDKRGIGLLGDILAAFYPDSGFPGLIGGERGHCIPGLGMAPLNGAVGLVSVGHNVFLSVFLWFSAAHGGRI